MLPHHSSSRSTQLQEDSTSVTCADRERAHQLGVSSKGGAPFLERDTLQVIGRAFGDSITWVLLARSSPSFLVLSERVLWLRLFLRAVGRIEEEGVFEIQIQLVWRGYTSDLTLRLHIVICSVPIYIPGEFQSIWRPPSSGPNYLGFQSSNGAHHSMEEFRSTGFERDFGDLDIWVVLTVAPSIIWHIYRDDWTLLVAGMNY